MPQTASNFLKVPEAAAELGVSEKTIRNWIDADLVAVVQPAGRGHTIRIDRRELLRARSREETRG